jgi:hypothetical protein
MSDIITTKVLTLRECGCDEAWLRDRICEDPSVLGLGNLHTFMKERSQSQGGRLDLLLKNLDDDAMYEVELQIGPTDESHIIRTIEYWDNERRRWPERSHTAVLVAEIITTRFFNVVQLLSRAVPIIGIQVNIVQAGEVRALHFTKIVDTYVGPGDGEEQRYDEKYWNDKWPGCLECVRWYRELLSKHYGDIPIKYFEEYIAITVGRIDRVWVNKRNNGRVFIQLKYDEADWDEAVQFLTQQGLSAWADGSKGIRYNVSLEELNEKRDVHDWLAQRLFPTQATAAVKG